MNEENIEKEKESFLIYNMSICKIKMTDSQYSEDTREMCEVSILSILTEAYKIEDVYKRILSWMQKNDLYEKYIRPILELQLNPPKQKEIELKNENGESSESEKSYNSEKKNGGVGTKTDRYKEISKKMIEDMFRVDENDF